MQCLSPANALFRAHRGQVWRDTKVLLRAALGNAEARHHLVKAQQRAVLCRDLPQALQGKRKLDL